MRRFYSLIWGAGLFAILLLNSVPCFGLVLESRHATITYQHSNDLRNFNDRLDMGRLGSFIKSSDTVEEEVTAKIDFIVGKVMTVLDMFPLPLKFYIVIRPDVQDVRSDFKRLYKMDVDYIAFYSPSRNKVFYSAADTRLGVVAHEIGHVVVENYFTVSPSQRVHEVMAQFAEQHIAD